MSNQWPPSSPRFKQQFQKAHDQRRNQAPAPELSKDQAVSKNEIQKLESQRKKTTAQLNLTPPGVVPKANDNRKRELRIAKMKERLKSQKGKARDDFGRSV